MKMSEYINFLKGVQKDFGDKEVLMASDNEGNSFMPISRGVGNEEKFIVLYPEHEYVELDGGF